MGLWDATNSKAVCADAQVNIKKIICFFFFLETLCVIGVGRRSHDTLMGTPSHLRPSNVLALKTCWFQLENDRLGGKRLGV